MFKNAAWPIEVIVSRNLAQLSMHDRDLTLTLTLHLDAGRLGEMISKLEEAREKLVKELIEKGQPET